MIRFRHPDGSVVHLSYCSNVHQAEDVEGIVAQLARFAGPVRRRSGVVAPRRRAVVARQGGCRPRVTTRTLDACARPSTSQQLDVVTLNGFPYEAFHAPVVKHAVYRPDWTEPARLEHTLDLARLLACPPSRGCR